MRIIVALALVLFILSLLSCASGSEQSSTVTVKCAVSVHLRAWPEGKWVC